MEWTTKHIAIWLRRHASRVLFVLMKSWIAIISVFIMVGIGEHSEQFATHNSKRELKIVDSQWNTTEYPCSVIIVNLLECLECHFEKMRKSLPILFATACNNVQSSTYLVYSAGKNFVLSTAIRHWRRKKIVDILAQHCSHADEQAELNSAEWYMKFAPLSHVLHTIS